MFSFEHLAFLIQLYLSAIYNFGIAFETYKSKNIKMDREISPQERRRVLRKQIAIYCGAGIMIIGIIMLCFSLARDSVALADIKLADVDRGDVDATIPASGVVAPAFEEVINSPITSRVVEVYHRAGDVVEAGTPLLRLDLAAAQTDYDSRLDELAMLRLELEQLRANNRTRLSELKKQIEVSRMKLRRMDAELKNERYLDSIGSGTTDRVREVELSRNSQKLELEQLEEQLANETDVKRADEQLKILQIEIKEKDIAQQGRTLGEAEIRAPRRATVTTIADRLGATVSTGQQVATIADLGHYRVDAQVAESYASEIKAGSRVWLKISRQTLEGLVGTVSPTARSGMLDVRVTILNDSASILRPGIKADVKISNGLRTDVVRVPNTNFYTGPASYQLYVRRPGADEIELRTVQLGAAGYDYVEVISGLTPGEQIVISDTKRFDNAPNIKLKE